MYFNGIVSYICKLCFSLIAQSVRANCTCGHEVYASADILISVSTTIFDLDVSRILVLVAKCMEGGVLMHESTFLF